MEFAIRLFIVRYSFHFIVKNSSCIQEEMFKINFDRTGKIIKVQFLEKKKKKKIFI